MSTVSSFLVDGYQHYTSGGALREMAGRNQEFGLLHRNLG
jgi:hypothetical protein